jgi:SAM-dependent methyltransferase
MVEVPPSGWETETFRYNSLHLRLQKVLREVAAVKPANVLEIGCGVGVLRKEILRLLPGIDYFGCDISHSAVSAIAHPRVVQADLIRDPLPFPGTAFDCVTGSGILEYLPDLESFLGQVRSRLRVGGTLVVSYYNMRHLYRRCLLALGVTPHRHPEWKNDLSLSQFEEVMARRGFEILKRVPVNVCLTRMKGPKAYQAPWVSKMQERAPEALLNLFAHQMIYVARSGSSVDQAVENRSR